jgi:aspartate/methionine/tyrosine aminotransferase
MKIPPFELERYFARHEFQVPHLLCGSDCESMAVGELLDWEPESRRHLDALWLGYTESLGHPELRAAIAGLYRRIRAEEVLVHTGAEEAIFNFMNAILEPADHVIVHWPCYQSLAQVAESIGCRVTRWEANPRAGWALDLEFLSDALRRPTRLVVLNQPHNPTGYLMPQDSFAQVLERVARAGCLLFADEVYRGLEYDTSSRLPAACDEYENAVSLGVMSKSLGLAGLRIGWIATRNRAVMEAMAQFKDYTTICNSAPSELLSVIALRHRDRILSRNRARNERNRQLLGDFFERHRDRFSWAPPRAGCIAFPQLNQGSAEAYCAALLSRSGVLLAPSGRFGWGDSHFRVGFGRGSFAEALAAWDADLRQQ